MITRLLYDDDDLIRPKKSNGNLSSAIIATGAITLSKYLDLLSRERF